VKKNGKWEMGNKEGMKILFLDLFEVDRTLSPASILFPFPISHFPFRISP
jgi:hypothetical protein